MPLDQLAVGIEIDQFLGHLLDIFLDPRRGLCPAGPAQPVQPRDVAVGAAVALDLVQPIQRDVQVVPAGELENQEIAFEILHGQALEAAIFRDAVLHMHDIVADVQILQRGEEGGGLGFCLRLVAGPFGEQLFFGQEREPKVSREKPRRKVTVQDIKRQFAGSAGCSRPPGVHGSAGKSCSRSKASKRSTCPRLRATKTTRCSPRRPSSSFRVWLKAVPLMLLGVAFDPNFAHQPLRLRLLHRAAHADLHNRVSRFTANGDVAVAGSEVIILDLDTLTSATNHNGGAHPLRPGRQALHRRRRQRQGRQRADAERTGSARSCGSTPTAPSRPTTRSSARPTGDNRAIWALGLRNPFTFAFQPGTGRCSSTTWARTPGRRSTTASPARTTAGPPRRGRRQTRTSAPPSSPTATARGPDRLRHHRRGVLQPGDEPVPAVSTSATTSSRTSATAGSRLLNPANNTATAFATGIARPGRPAGRATAALYYLARGNGVRRFRINYTGESGSSNHLAPREPDRLGGPVRDLHRPGLRRRPRSATSGSATASTSPGPPPRATRSRRPARRQRRAVPRRGDQLLRHGDQQRGHADRDQRTSRRGQITAPAAGTLYSAGDTSTTRARAPTRRTARCPASAFTWQVDFHHDTHVHPFMPPTTGVDVRLLHHPDTGETSANVWYRFT